MPTPILMPALSPTMEVGTLAKWLVATGDKVAPGDVIAEIETDKATMEVEAVDEGVMGDIVVQEGTADVAVNTPIAFLVNTDDEDAPAPAVGTADPVPPAPAAPQPAPELTPVVATAGMNGAHPRPFASPLARRLAQEAGIALADVHGSGPHGRIVKRDVESAIGKGGSPAPSPASAQAPSAATAPVRASAPAPSASLATPVASVPSAGLSDEQIRSMYPAGAYTELPHDMMRRTIARRLVEAKQTIPHFYLTRDLTIDALIDLRAQINAAASVSDGKPAYKISVNDFIIKALALALRDVPMANATFLSTARLIQSTVDVGVAVAIDDGLITPVVRAADTKSLSDISNEMRDLAARARQKRLKPEEYQGGTTAVSNLGMYGIKEFAAVINPPQSSILAVGAGERRPVVRDGAVVAATVMSVTLSVDHRAVDGALGAELLQAFAGRMENPLGMLI